MKKLLLIMTIIAFTFQSCSNDDDGFEKEISPYAGTYSGTYDGSLSGTWRLIFSETGDFISGYLNYQDDKGHFRSATIDTEGKLICTFDNGGWAEAQITETTLNGTWGNTNFNTSGNWSGNKN